MVLARPQKYGGKTILFLSWRLPMFMGSRRVGILDLFDEEDDASLFFSERCLKIA